MGDRVNTVLLSNTINSSVVVSLCKTDVAYVPFIINDVQLAIASNVLFQPPQSRLDQFLVPAGEEASQGIITAYVR